MMSNKEYHDAVTLYCKSCGELVQVAGMLEDDRYVLCVRCAFSAAERSGAHDTEQLEASEHSLDVPYVPNDRERQWWDFLTWMIATQRLTVGPTEGANELRRAIQNR